MRLNTLSPAEGAKTKKMRLGRGIGCTKGKTCGRGHKGQHSRAGGYHKVGFEGGQMPLQRRLPKFGFNSRKALVTAEVSLIELNKVTAEVINLKSLREAGLITSVIKFVKIIKNGELAKTVNVNDKNIKVTKGAREVIESNKGSVTEA